MTREELAAKLNGREYESEITHEEEQEAKENGLVVVYGNSDDLCEFVGAINDEVECYDGGTIFLDSQGIFSSECDSNECKLLRRHLNQCKTINAIFMAGEYVWIYETSIPHATFDILEGGEKYCRGIVFDMAYLAGGVL